jgi:hypothetical protein
MGSSRGGPRQRRQRFGDLVVAHRQRVSVRNGFHHDRFTGHSQIKAGYEIWFQHIFGRTHDTRLDPYVAISVSVVPVGFGGTLREPIRVLLPIMVYLFRIGRNSLD